MGGALGTGLEGAVVVPWCYRLTAEAVQTTACALRCATVALQNAGATRHARELTTPHAMHAC